MAMDLADLPAMARVAEEVSRFLTGVPANPGVGILRASRSLRITFTMADMDPLEG